MTFGEILTGIFLVVISIPVFRVIIQPVVVVIGMIIYGNGKD